MMNHGLCYKLEDFKTGCLVIGLFADSDVTELPIKAATQTLIAQLKTRLTQPDDTLLHADEQNSHDLLLIHCGDNLNFTPAVLKQQLIKIASLLTSQRTLTATIVLPQLPKHSPDWQIEQMIVNFEAKAYQFLALKTEKNQGYALQSLEWYLPDATEGAVHNAQAVAAGIRSTRNLANLPANICTPTYLANEARKMDQAWATITTQVFDQAAITQLKMGALLAVAQGSIEPPQFIQIHYQGPGASAQPPIVLIGKGITFDSGGISLKPPECMEEMKFDMAGAATVLGTLQACAALNLPIHVIGLLACAENMPSGSAIKPGDVITTMAGLSVEITNTDAEGRLVLADALHYAKQFHPKFVIDIATLTGAMVIALGNITTGFMTNDQTLADLLVAAGEQSQEKIWRMPLDPEYLLMLDSPIADMQNATAGRIAGSITAACFLSRFAESFKWAHLDIAGTAWVSGKDRCATGRPVALLVQMLRALASHAS